MEGEPPNICPPPPSSSCGDATGLTPQYISFRGQNREGGLGEVRGLGMALVIASQHLYPCKQQNRDDDVFTILSQTFLIEEVSQNCD